MKKVLFIVAIAGLTMASCKKGWSDSEKKAYTDACVGKASSALGEEKATEYCNCTLEKIMAKYPSASELNDVSADEKTKVITEIATECMK